MSLSLIERMVDSACLKCAACGAPKGGCDCWSECRCGWSYPKGGECSNPEHAIEQVATEIAASVISHMRTMYRDPMQAASGGFQKTLRATVIREICSALKPSQR